MKEEIVRPGSSSSNGSGVSNPGIRSSLSGGSFCSDTLDPNGNPVRRSGRARRKPKRPLDSESGDNETNERSRTELEESSRNKRPVRSTRNAGKRASVRYREDSDHEERRNSRSLRERPQRQPDISSSSEDDDEDEEDENEDPCDAKYRPSNGRSGGLKRKRQSAQEATKKIRSDFANTSNDDDDDASERVAVPTYGTSSRGRVRKLVQYATQEFFD